MDNTLNHIRIKLQGFNYSNTYEFEDDLEKYLSSRDNLDGCKNYLSNLKDFLLLASQKKSDNIILPNELTDAANKIRLQKFEKIIEKKIEVCNDLIIKKEGGITNLLPPVPKRKLKKLAKDYCEKMIESYNENGIHIPKKETKSGKEISSKVIEFMSKDYSLKSTEKKSVSYYFYSNQLSLSEKAGKIIVKAL